GLFHDKRLTRFRKALEKEGYRFKKKILNVADFGVPQRRRRLVVLATRLSEVTFANRAKKRRTVRDAIGNLSAAGTSGDSLHDIKENRQEITRKRIAAVPKNGGSRSSWPKRLRLGCHDKSDGFKDVYGR